MALEALKKIEDIKNIAEPQTEVPEETVAKSKWIVFCISNDKYAVREKYVRKILKDSKIFDYPFSPDFVQGVINFQNNICTSFDFRKLCKKKSDNKYPLLIVFCNESDDFALSASTIVDLFLIPDNIFEEIDLSETSETENNFICGYINIREEKIPVLDIDKISCYVSAACK